MLEIQEDVSFRGGSLRDRLFYTYYLKRDNNYQLGLRSGISTASKSPTATVTPDNGTPAPAVLLALLNKLQQLQTDSGSWEGVAEDVKTAVSALHSKLTQLAAAAAAGNS